jgi:hypothetical protein
MTSRTTPRRGLARALAAGIACAGLVACQSMPRPTAQLAQAEQAIARAEQAKAAEHAPLELRKARDDYEKAKAAAREEENVKARRAAERAQLEAELAAAKAQRARAEELVSELSNTTEALQEETMDGVAAEMEHAN